MTEAEMMQDLAAADSAGDSTLAQHIAGQIKALRTPADTHGLPAKIAHYGAMALPTVGGVTGGVLAGVPAIPSGAGALLTGAAGAGLGAGAGRALQKSIDQYLGYEKPNLKRDLMDVGSTGLRDATYATGAGVATAGLAKAAPLLAGALKAAAQGTEKRILQNSFGSLSKSKPLSDAAVDAAAGRGAFKLFGTSGGAAQRLEAAREAVGGQYAGILADLEKQGITGPDAQRLARAYAARQQAVNATTMNPAVPGIYGTAAEQIAGKPTTGGRLGLSQTEELKRSAQGMAKSAYKQMQPNEVGQAHEEVASIIRQAVEDEVSRQAANASPAAQEAAARFVPVKKELGGLIEASNVAHEGMARSSKRNAISLPDWLAATSGYAHHGNPIEGATAALATHMLRSRGPSTAAVLLRGSSNLANAFPAVAPDVERTAMSIAPAAAERGQLAALIRALQQKQSPMPQLAQAQ